MFCVQHAIHAPQLVHPTPCEAWWRQVDSRLTAEIAVSRPGKPLHVRRDAGMPRRCDGLSMFAAVCPAFRLLPQRR